MSASRRGFTLLEVSLAMAIAVVLLGGLYMILSLQMYQMRSGRDIIEQNALARVLVMRISNDISAHLGPIDPRIVSAEAIQEAATGSTSTAPTTETTDASSANGTATPTGTDTSGTKSSGTTSGTGATSSNSSTSDASTSESETTGGNTLFNLGIQGDETHLVLYVSQVPSKNNENGPVSDLRRVCWWFAGSAEAPLGLARYEVNNATSADGLTTEVPADPEPYIISNQVTNLMFEYYDGSDWVPGWDGTALLADGKTPMGPPVAIAINLTITVPEARGGPPRQTTMRHVVFLPAANGVASSLGGLTP